jgi:endonuclease G
MNKNYFFTFISVFGILIFFDSCQKDKVEYSLEHLEIPSVNGNQIISHYAYTLQYDEKYEQADWVAYVLTKDEAESSAFARTDDFRPDPAVTTGSADNADYSGSGYDRGHLAPAGDMQWSATAMTECFFYSNMSPQAPGFNRGKWETLESQVRLWAAEYGKLYIVTGGILHEGLPTIGHDKVAVPEYFYKVILDYDHNKAIGFLMKNETLSKQLSFYAVPIDDIENLTGIDFFYQLSDEQQSDLESKVDLAVWGLN